MTNSKTSKTNSERGTPFQYRVANKCGVCLYVES